MVARRLGNHMGDSQIGLEFAVIAVFAVLLQGCYAVYTPKSLRQPLRTAEKAQLDVEEPWGDITVGVGKNSQQWRSNQDLVDDLDTTHLFDRVVSLDKIFFEPTLLVEIQESVDAKSPLPLLTIATLGLIPTIWRDQIGHRFSIRRPGIDRRVQINHTVRPIAVIGLWAAPLLLFPGWSTDTENLRESDLYADRFKLAVLLKRQEIAALVSSDGRSK
jgi:hypothetical protein